ncbi:MAG TPA: AAA family ATPase [Mycobacteriales bacterium]|nr:AAA family ATPase [Mycobacteriales bacterium]
MPIEVSPTPLVGRREELRGLAELVGAGKVAAGAVLLGGDAGAGKTRLVAELTGQVGADGWRVLIGHCLDFGDSSLPYLPFSEALGRLAADSPERAAELVERNPALGPLLPRHRLIREQSEAGSADASEPTGRAALFDAVHAGLNQLGADGPLLVIIEDVHWADQSTRDLIRLLLARQFDSPVAILATYRSDDLHRRHPLRADLAEWSRLPAVSRMQLGPLADADARALIRSLADTAIEEDELRQILDRAEGNPFFIEELVDARLATGGQLPVDLADLLLVRLEQLDDDGRLVVRAAAVVGRRVSHVLLAHGTDLDEARLEDALRAAVEANILVPLGGDGYAFRHALLAEAIYQDLLPGERVRLHARYAAALANGEVDGAAAELARHARASHDLDTATRASVQAGDEAMVVGGPEEALHHYELALELLSDRRGAEVSGSDGRPIDRTAVVLRASAAAAAAGHLVRSVALADNQLRSLPADAPPLDRARLIHAIALTAQVMDHQMDILALTSEATQLMADQPPSALRANVLLVHARANADRAHDDDAARWACEALAIARDLDLAAVATDAKILLAKIDARGGDPQAAEASISAAIDTARAGGESFAEVRGIYHLASLHYAQGRVPQAMELFAEAAKRACALGRQWGPYGLDAVGFGAIATVVNGDWDKAEEMVDLTGLTAPEFASALFQSVAMEIAAGRGDLRGLDLLPDIRRSWDIDGMVAITSGPAAIELYGYAGDLAAAQAIHDDTIATVHQLWQHMDFAGRVRLAALMIGQLARAATTAGSAERAELVRRGDELAAKAERVADRVRYLGPEGRAWVARSRAEKGRLHWLAGIDPPDEATLIADWRAAADGFEQFGHVYETARSRARLASVLLAAGETGEAGKQARLARETATRLGARPLLEELSGFESEGPAPVRGSTSRLGEPLTTREQEVLELVASGRSNREIGQQLFISAKTVSVHVSNLMAKLDAGSRTEAVAIARRNGVLS